MSTSRPLSLTEVRSMIALTDDPRNRALLTLAAATGLRSAELRSLRWSAVLTPACTFTGSLHLPRRSTKGKTAARSLPLAPPAIEALARLYQAHPNPVRQAHIFTTGADNAPPLTTRTIHRIVVDAARRAGLAPGVSPHSLRKFFGTTVYHATGRDIAQASQALGHSTTQCTARYLDLARDQREAAILTIFGHREDPLPHLQTPDPPAPSHSNAA